MITKQKPIGSGFGPTTAASDVVLEADLLGKTAIVTGGPSGLGLETVFGLLAAGANVIVPTRSPLMARERLYGLSRVEHASLDLLDATSIRSFAAGIVASGRPVHLLINNAGVMATPLRRDSRGYEGQFATNHLGHFHLTLELWPALRRSHGARVVSLSSRGHHISGINFNDPNFDRRPYETWTAYGQSKTANALFTVALDVRGADDGIRAFSVHPGTILTDLARNLSEEELNAFGVSKGAAHGYIPPGLSVTEGGDYKSIEQGAATTLWCATSRMLDELGGVYCENCDVAPLRLDDSLDAIGVRPWAVDSELADRLWVLSEDLTDTRLN